MDRISHGPLIVAIDFDGVIHNYSKGWHDGTIYDGPADGAADSIRELFNCGVEIIIHSVRATPREVNGVAQPGQYEEMHAWLEKYQIPFHRIHTGFGKPLAHIYLDDRGYRHTHWLDSMEFIRRILSHIGRSNATA